MNDPNTVLIVLLVVSLIANLHALPTTAKLMASIEVREYGIARLLVGWVLSAIITGLWIWFAAVTGYWLIAAIFGSQFLVTRAVSAASMQRRKAGVSS